MALQQLALTDPYNFIIPILTQWGMLGGMLLINIFVLPESPWWLVQRSEFDKAEAVLAKTHKGVDGYNVKSELVRLRYSNTLFCESLCIDKLKQNIIVATVERERQFAAGETNQYREIFRGVNLWRLFICFWPKGMQQLTGQSVTNNYGTYFCEYFPTFTVLVWKTRHD